MVKWQGHTKCNLLLTINLKLTGLVHNVRCSFCFDTFQRDSMQGVTNIQFKALSPSHTTLPSMSDHPVTFQHSLELKHQDIKHDPRKIMVSTWWYYLLYNCMSTLVLSRRVNTEAC